MNDDALLYNRLGGGGIFLHVLAGGAKKNIKKQDDVRMLDRNSHAGRKSN